jgi:hypothetical protein
MPALVTIPPASSSVLEILPATVEAGEELIAEFLAAVLPTL